MPEIIKKSEISSEPKFRGQRQDEKFLLIFRRHLITTKKGWTVFLIVFIISSLPFLIWQNNLDLIIIAAVGFVSGMLFALYHIALWYFTYVIITDQRIRQFTQRGLFAKNVVDLRLSKIQNISYSIPGMAGELFHFGTITIRTIVGDLIINNVNRPERVYNVLQDAINSLNDSGVKNEEII